MIPIPRVQRQRSDQGENQNHSENQTAANNQPENILENVEVDSEDILAESTNMDFAENTENLESENSCMSHATTSTQSQHVCCNKGYVKMNALGSFQRHCCICKSKEGRVCVPNHAIAQAWTYNGVLIPKLNCCCRSHLNAKREFNAEALEIVKTIDNPIDVSGPSVFDLLQNVTNQFNSKLGRMDFTEAGSLQDVDFERLLGMNIEQFSDLFTYVKNKLNTSCNRKPKNALAMFLMKLKLDLSQEFLGFFFEIHSQPRVSDTLKAVASALMESFVPQFLGVNHLIRNEYSLNHKSQFVHRRFEIEGNNIAAIIDGTYVYINKPSGWLVFYNHCFL